MNKKAITPIIIILIAIIVLTALISFIIFLVIISTDILKKTPGEELIPFFLQARDKKTLEPVKANYRIEYNDESRVVFEQGNLKASWNELLVPKRKLTITVWSDDYYLTRGIITHDTNEIANNKSITMFDLDKIGNITTEVFGDIDSKLSILKLNISSKDNFKRITMCFSWTSGFKDVSTKNSFIECQEGTWKNWSSYDIDTKKYEYLYNDTYQCGKDRIEICQFIKGRLCKPIELDTKPRRFKLIADHCVYLGKSIDNSTLEVELQVQSLIDNNCFDEIKIWIFDKDKTWNPETNRYGWFSEFPDGSNAGNPNDFEVVLTPKGCERYV